MFDQLDLAWVRPGWFPGSYRVSALLGSFLSQAVARGVLVVVFLLIIVPLGLLLRLLATPEASARRRRTNRRSAARLTVSVGCYDNMLMELPKPLDSNKRKLL
jgi:hypothetical protein